MGRQSKPKNGSRETSNVIGKGNVTPVQVAFIVDRYLADNNYTETRSVFRSEASSLIAKSPAQEAPKSLLSLRAMLDEYISLKEQKVIVDQEKCRLEQEKCRVQQLLQGMQDVMNAYNSNVNSLTLPVPVPTMLPSVPAKSMGISPAGYAAYKTPTTNSIMPHGSTNFSTPILNSRPSRKRKNYKDLQDAPQASKRACGPLPSNQLLGKDTCIVRQTENATKAQDNIQHSPTLASSSHDQVHTRSPVEGSTVAKNLFNNATQSPTSNSPGPKTPPQPASSQSDQSISPIEDISSSGKSNNTPTNYTIISSKTIIVSPSKRFCIERNQCTFSSPAKSVSKRQGKRDHVKGRLDFDGSDVINGSDNANGDLSTTSESEEGAIFDLDLPGFDAFGSDFSISELLTDFGIDCGEMDYACPSNVGASVSALPGQPQEPVDGELGPCQDLQEHSAAASEGDVNLKAPNTTTSVKSITKGIRIVSPVKNFKSSFSQDQDNSLA